MVETMSRRRELVSHLPEFSRLYAERRELLEFDRNGSIAPEWVKGRLEAIEREIDFGLEALETTPYELAAAAAETLADE